MLSLCHHEGGGAWPHVNKAGCAFPELRFFSCNSFIFSGIYLDSTSTIGDQGVCYPGDADFSLQIQREGALHQRQSTRGWVSGSASAILAPILSSLHTKQPDTKMEQAANAALQSPGALPSSPPDPEADTAAITKSILEAIDACKAALMVRIDHLAWECTLIRHDLDKIRGRLTKAEDRISQLPEL